MTDRDTPLDIYWTQQARADLIAIGEYIGADNPTAALRWVERLMASVAHTAELPYAGRVVPELPNHRDVREVITGTEWSTACERRALRC